MLSIDFQNQLIKRADSCINLKPETITNSSCPRSSGGKHDFYSEGDYWWPNPSNPSGTYIQRDGLTNPDNFLNHRRAMVRFSQIIGALAAGYKIKSDKKYVSAANLHLKAWFKDTTTLMNPSLNFAQAIKGKATGRAIGIIDMIQLIEVAQALRIFEKTQLIPKKEINAYKQWFSAYLKWINSHKYGLEEREAKNNHGTCWVLQVAVFAKFVGDKEMLEYCKARFKTVLLPNQLAKDGSFPLEMARTKPYGYALFNLDAMCTIANILSDNKQNLFDYRLEKGQNLHTAVDFMFPFVKDKTKWQLKPDVMYWNEWPVAQPFLYFYFKESGDKKYFNLWQSLKHFPEVEEVIRNLPVRNPIIWD